MIAANEAVSAALVRHREPALHRVHERPDPVRLEQLAELLDPLGYRVPQGNGAVRPGAFDALLAEARGRPEEPWVQRQVLRTMALARYDQVCLGHFGLALRRYAHFTSPIRRYPDLVVHRALRRLGEGGASETERADHRAALAEQGPECSRRERDAEAAEREALAWRMGDLMAEKLGEQYDARIVDIGPWGIGVALDQPAVEGSVRVARLGPEYFRFDPRRLALVGSGGRRFRVGQRLQVLVDRVDPVRHWIEFALASEVLPAKEAPRRGRRGRKARQAPEEPAAEPGRRGGRGRRSGSRTAGQRKTGKPRKKSTRKQTSSPRADKPRPRRRGKSRR